MLVVPLSAVLLTYNEAANVEPTLRNLAGWCAELHVVDSGSTDRTLNLVRPYTSHIYHHPYQNHSAQWRWVLTNVPFKYEWMLLVDADFVMTERLKTLIAETVEAAPDHVAGYFVIHRQVFRGKEIRFGGTKKWWLRLVRHRQVQIDGTELVDFRLAVKGATARLHGIVYEDNRKEHNIDFWIDKHQAFAGRMAVEEVLRREGLLQWKIRPRFLGNPDERILWLKQVWYRLPLYMRPFLYFGFRYILCLGILDGKEGFLFHFLQAFWYRLMIDVKMAEIYGQIQRGELSLQELRSRYLPADDVNCPEITEV